MASKSSKTGKTRTKESSTKSSSTTLSSWWWYIIAILPIPILFLSSNLLRHTISEPDANHGSGSMFDLIATRYDFINRALALNLDMSWRYRLVEEIVGVNGQIFQQSNDVRLLDLATGTADVAILLGQAAARYNYPPSSKSSSSTTDDNDTSSTTTTVLGLDPSQNMLNVGKAKVQSKELTNIVRLDLGDARKLDELQDNTFNAATMSFGIRNVPEKVDALCEIHRVLKKANVRSSSNSIESKLAIMEFSEPGDDKGIMGDLARLFIRHLVPAMGALLSGHPKEYMHLQKSIKDFPTPSEFVKKMEGIKCPIRKEEDEGRQVFGTFRVAKVVNLNFGSVQIYVANPIMKEYVTE